MILRNITCKYFLHVCKRSYSANNLNIANVLNKKNAGDEIIVQGWVKSVRKMKEYTFFDISDGSISEKLQILIDNNAKPNNLTTGASVKVNGNLSLTDKEQLELKATDCEVIGECIVTEGYPFAPRKKYAPEYIRQYLHLRNRTNKFSSLLRLRDSATVSIHEHLHEKGFINIHTPILTSNDCEGAGEVFTVSPEDKSILKNMKKEGIPLEESYFDSKVFLTVSAQLHLEAIAHGISKVYSFGPTFRAENSRSRLHLSEFYMLESEIAFMNNIDELMLTIEDLIKGITNKIIDKSYSDIIQAQENELDLSWIHKQFPVITYNEAVNILKQENTNFKAENGFTKEDEVFLVEYCGGAPTFIINFPKDEKPFYMKECEGDSSKVAALDLLGPNVGEIVGGSLREDDYETLKNKLPSDKLDWYLDLRKFGSVPTGGFGLGFERYLQLLLGISNIKDTIPYPRWPHNCKL